MFWIWLNFYVRLFGDHKGEGEGLDLFHFHQSLIRFNCFSGMAAIPNAILATTRSRKRAILEEEPKEAPIYVYVATTN